MKYLAFVVVRAETMARVKAGALCSTGAASSALTGEIDSACSVSTSVLRLAVGRWVAGSVLIEYSRARAGDEA